LFSLATIFSGEESEEKVEHRPVISEIWLEKHEELADAAKWVLAILDVLTLVGIWNEKNELISGNLMVTMWVVIHTATLIYFARLNNVGGKI